MIRSVLGNLDNLQPFSGAHFNVFPHKKLWEGASKVMCRHRGRKLRAFYSYPPPGERQAERQANRGELEPREKVARQSPSISEPQLKRRRIDSPLEDAILQDLMKDLEAESKVPVVR